jgi:chromosome segregation ATPase
MRLSVAKAAKVLGVSEQAVYARVKRGTIDHEKGEHGEITVFLDPEQENGQTVDQSLDNPLVNDYITALKSEIETLKSHTESLITDREEWKEEARRKDTIIAQMNQTMGSLITRLPELEAPQDTPPEATESPVTASDEENRGVIPPEPQNRSWWRRILAP